MSWEACAAFFKSKSDQAQEVFAERFAPILSGSDVRPLEWAANKNEEVYARYKSSEEQINGLWANGVFDEEFKRQVLEHFRALLEIFRGCAAELRRQA